MIKLTIDRGNTSVKADIWKDKDLLASYQGDSDDAEELLHFFEGWNPEAAILSSVKSGDYLFDRKLEDFFRERLLIYSPEVPVPLKIKYDTPSSLGADRVAAAVGATLAEPKHTCLVADCGTALTLDIVTEKGEFKGGNISPGLNVRFKALAEWTSALPLVAVSGEVPEFGYDTLTAIRAGVVRGEADEIYGSFERAKKLEGASIILMTGGDAEILDRYINKQNAPVVYIKNLVGFGLLGILDYNLQKK